MPRFSLANVRFHLFPCERVVLLFTALTVFLYRRFGVMPREPFALYREKCLGGLMWYVTGLVLCLFLLRLGDLQRSRRELKAVSRGESLARYCRSYLAAAPLLCDLRLVHALAVNFVLFIELKHLIPVVNSALYDELLLQSDHLLCGGVLCAERVMHFFGFAAAADWIRLRAMRCPDSLGRR